MSDVTRILNALEQGDDAATGQLMPLLYDELRRLAAHKLSLETPGQTLQATALVHEAYIRLVGDESASWENRYHFFGAAAEAMRRILIENARRKKSQKRGGDHQRLHIDKADVPVNVENSDDLLALDDALSRLAHLDPVKAELVKLRFFSGLNIDQAADILGISRTTAIRHWSFARIWLLRDIKKNR